MALLRRKKDPRSKGMSPVTAGVIALVLIMAATFYGFTRFNPFAEPFELKATFRSANNLQKNSPVRVAGVEVGKVTDVKPISTSGGAKVTMEIMDKGLPIHEDAELKIRPRIFLEGNFFVDIQPGSPDADEVASGFTVPVNQTSTPVQFGQLLTALQSDTREDLKTFLSEYAVKGLGNGGAEAYNRSLDYAPDAFRNASIANDATLGMTPHDLSHLLRGQQRLFRSLDSNPGALKDLITQLNITGEALSRNDQALEATLPALRDTLRVGTPALESLDRALPSLRAFAREALPGTRSSGPTIDASMPLITQLRLLVRPQELRGLVRDLRPTIPALARVNKGSIGLLSENRALSACTNEVLLPFATTPIPNPDEPDNNNQPFYKQAPRGLVGLAGESRISDANSPYFHIQFGAGPTTVVQTHQDTGTNFFSQLAGPPTAVRPAKTSRPPFRPGVPCETQEPPDMHAPGGPADRSVTAPGSGLLPPLPKNEALAKRGEAQVNQLQHYMDQTAKGKPAPDPLALTPKEYRKQMSKLGFKVMPNGKVVVKAASK
jgi:virulence factor Mce-like protein